LWRWAFHARVETANNGFDRFWDQMLVWLSASREILPSRPYTLQISPVNVPLGDKVFFRLNEREPDPALGVLPLQILVGDREVARVTLGRAPGEGRLAAEYTPETLGRHRVNVTLPGGTRAEGRFIVYSENTEETEVATDISYLRRLCAGTGGRLVTAAELPKLLTELRTEPERAAGRTRLVSLWDRAWCFWLTIGAFALDWYLRRRWGLS
jgi:hypothetical protein